MNDLTDSVMNYFRQISAIPRQSGNEQGMQDYLINFACKHNLSYYQDEHKNVIIYKKTTDKEPIILQAHTDMVYVTSTNPFCAKQKKGIKLVQKGQWLTAKGTSLGADDGIGVAMILSFLASDIPCNIEAVFTAAEETTMQGAYQIDISKLTAKKLICLDGFENNTIVVSTASFTDFLITLDQTTQTLDADYHWYQITLKGLLGGHSGFDIDKQRGNSHQLMTKLLKRFPNVFLSRFIGGYQFNVIPTETSAVFATNVDEGAVKDVIEAFINEYSQLYTSMEISSLKIDRPQKVLSCGNDLLNFFEEFQYGVLSKDNQNNVIASQNLSEVNTDKGTIKIGLRANSKKEEQSMLYELQALCNKHHLTWSIVDTQPGFETLPNSKLLSDLQQTNPNTKTIKMHIAVECGIFQNRIKNLDTVIISPTILCAHSVQERLDLDSVKNTVNWLEKYLRLN